MHRQITFYRVAFVNILLAALVLASNNYYILFIATINICLLNAICISIILHSLSRILKPNHERLFIGRKRTLTVFACSIYIFITVASFYFEYPPAYFFLFFLCCTLIISCAYIFADSIAFRLHKTIRRNRRIAVAGYDDNANRFAEKLKRKSYSNFVAHIGHNAEAERTNAEILSGYISYAKANQVKELYISIPEDESNSIAALMKEAEKYCIRINFIAPQQSFETGFYHVSYIGGMSVLGQYKEPLKSLSKQILKRSFDLLVSTLVIIFILSWLIPLISMLIKLDSQGPVFFKQLRSGRDNDSFTCLKFRSMHINNSSENLHTIKGDNRITRVGKFLRKTSIDEFPQFLNVFMGDMSIVGPRPHMLLHTEEYSDKVKHYMVRLYLKPGLTGWAQVNGYRGEVKNVEYMEQRVEHDIWYMENWNVLLDIKIMYITLLDVLKGDEMAY